MGTMTVVRQGSSGDGTYTNAGPDARRSGRIRKITAAQVAFGGTALDCALLDVSPGGVRVLLVARAEVPEHVTLRLRGGETRAVRRRWQQGSLVGLEFVGTNSPTAIA